MTVHGWCYGLKDGLVKDLEASLQGRHEVADVVHRALCRYPHSEGEC